MIRVDHLSPMRSRTWRTGQLIVSIGGVVEDVVGPVVVMESGRAIFFTFFFIVCR